MHLHDLNGPPPINLTASFPLSGHLHNILYESETAPRLPSTPIAGDLPFPCKPVHPAPVNDGTARRPGINRRAAGDFSVARKGGDEFRDEGILLVSEAETAVARTTPDEDVSAMWVNAGLKSSRGRMWRGKQKTDDVPVRIDRKTVLWTSGDLDDLPVIQTFYES